MSNIVQHDNRKNKLIKQSFMLFAVTVSLAAVVFAWMYNQSDGEADDMRFTTEGALGFRITLNANDNGEYKIQTDFPDNLDLVPVSGTGEDLYLPILDVGSSSAGEYKNGQFVFDKDVVWTRQTYSTSADAVNHFFTGRLYFRCSTDGDVMIKNISVNSPKNNTAAKRQNTDESQVDNVATGDFSSPVITDSGENYITKDYICAAGRCAFVSGTGQHIVVIPNDTYTLTVTDVTGGVKLSMNEDDTSTKTVESFYVVESDGTAGLRDFGNQGYTVWKESAINVAQTSYSNVCRICNLAYDSTETSEYKYKGYADFYFWIEGFDNEAVSYFEDGDVVVSVTFKYVEKAV